MSATVTRCPDGGRCHHGCDDTCWRVDNAAPLSAHGDDWSDADRRTPPRPEPGRRIVKVEPLETWLTFMAGTGPVVASLPDADELGLDPTGTEYDRWMRHAMTLCMTTSTGPTVFFLTDRLGGGVWTSKAAKVFDVASSLGISTLWHKIALRRDVGATNLHRPTFSHIIALGPGRPGRRTPDVWPSTRSHWANGCPIGVADGIARWLVDVGATTLVNPACGVGTIVAAGVHHGLDSYGCDTDPDCVDRARTLDHEHGGNL